jgi:T-complex protein 1 subunit delta
MTKLDEPLSWSDALLCFARQIENTVVISDYQQMDRILKEERNFIAEICKKVAKTGCNVILLQKSILRDAITDLGLHFLAKLKIMLIRDIERDQIEFICKVLTKSH